MTDALIERIALAILNSDRNSYGRPPVDSILDGNAPSRYVTNAHAILPIIEDEIARRYGDMVTIERMELGKQG